MKKILLIEDNEDIRNNTAEILELSNYKVITAENGKAGVEMAIKHVPDLIICDIMMPVLDGYGVLHAVHKNEAIKNTPFIFLTAKTDRNDIRKGMELGADDYITKPFTVTELLNAVDSRIKRLDLLKADIAAGLDGLYQIMQAAGGKNELLAFTEGRNINRYKKKQIVYSEGNHPNCLYYVLKGKVKVSMRNDDGKELVTELFNAGDFLGYVALLEESVYQDTAKALEDTELAVIPKIDFDELMANNREVTHTFIKLLAKNVSAKEKQLLGIAYNSLRKKVAEALLLLLHKYSPGDDDNFVIGINREILAAIAGTAKESLIRTLGDFRNEKLIEIKDGSIIILDEHKLEHLVN
jgi:CRP-like cAMP-binding protein/AmiR/NasT family two-component response regulator